MAGSPLKRQRKLGVRQKDGSIIAFQYMPRVTDLPPGWRHFSAAQKIEHLIGLDRCYEILSWPWAGLDPLRRSMQIQVIRVLLPIGIKAPSHRIWRGHHADWGHYRRCRRRDDAARETTGGWPR